MRQRAPWPVALIGFVVSAAIIVAACGGSGSRSTQSDLLDLTPPPSATPRSEASGAGSSEDPAEPSESIAGEDGRFDLVCLPEGIDENDPEAVCVEQGWFVRNISSREIVVRLVGGLAGDFLVEPGDEGQLTPIGPVWDAGEPVTIEVLDANCRRLKALDPGDATLALVRIPRRGGAQLLKADRLPPEPMPMSRLATTDMCEEAG